MRRAPRDTVRPRPDPTVVDVRALESIDLLAFERMVRVFVERRSVWTARTGPHAILHGSEGARDDAGCVPRVATSRGG